MGLLPKGSLDELRLMGGGYPPANYAFSGSLKHSNALIYIYAVASLVSWIDANPGDARPEHLPLKCIGWKPAPQLVAPAGYGDDEHRGLGTARAKACAQPSSGKRDGWFSPMHKFSTPIGFGVQL